MRSPLIDAPTLRSEIEAGAVVVVDCRWYLGEPDAGFAAYQQGHLPGAVYASLDEHLSGKSGPGRHSLPDVISFARSMELLGISNDSFVVAYDDRGGAVASRLWWMLTAQGCDNVAVLDGGVQAWVAAGGPLTTDRATPVSATFTPQPWAGVVDIHDVAGRADNVAVLDARSAERYRGDQEPVDPKAGHIPGALSAPLTGNLDDDLAFYSADQLRQRFVDLGITDGTTAISQCGSGVTACHNILAMQISGLGRPDLYVGSWSEWSNSDRPIATGDTP